MFIHVFDDVSIKRVLEHLNTITDFTQYLNKRAQYLRSGRLLLAHGEEELLASYLRVGIATGGNYDFEPPRRKGTEDAAMITVQGEWSAYVLSEAYFAKSLADDISYVWDRLINVFTFSPKISWTARLFRSSANRRPSQRLREAFGSWRWRTDSPAGYWGKLSTARSELR
jgi:hypothetical protein